MNPMEESSATSSPHHNAEIAETCLPEAGDKLLLQSGQDSLSDSSNSNAIALESVLKKTLQQLGVLVGKQVDIQRLDEVLKERLDDLDTLRKVQEKKDAKPTVESESGETPAVCSDSPESGQPSGVIELPSPDVSTDLTGGNECKETSKEVDDVQAKFVSESVKILIVLEDTLVALVADREIHDPKNDKELLGLVDQRMIHTMLELIVCWGIYPCLLPGVGMPLNRRVRSHISQKNLFIKSVESAKTGAHLDQIQSSDALWELIQPLSKISIAYSQNRTRFTTISSILVNRYIPDLYAALLQMAYRPLPKLKAAGVASEAASSSDQPGSLPAKPTTKLTPGNLTGRGARSTPRDVVTESSLPSPLGVSQEQSQERQRRLYQKEEGAKLFYDLFWNTEAARSLESLTILLNSGTSLHPVPTWLKSVCGRFLSQILLRPGGVRVVLEYMLGIGGGSGGPTPDGGSTVKLDQLEKVSRLVTSVPDQASSAQEYYHTICPELLEILEQDINLMDPSMHPSHRKQMTPPSPQLVQTATFVVGKILTKAPALGHYEIVVREVEPLWRWGTRANVKSLKEKRDITNSPSSIIPNLGTVSLDPAPSAKKVTIVEIDDQEDKEGSDDEAVVMDPLAASEYELSKAVMFLHKFLVGNEPSPSLFDAFLAQSVQGLYRLYEFTIQTRSVLKELAKEILVVYMRILEPLETVEVLKSIVMRRRMHTPQSKPWQNRITPPTEGKTTNGVILPLLEMGSAREAYFAPGPTGGVVLRRRRVEDKEAATQLELDVDAFLDLLNDVEASGQGEITGDLYMYLLDEYQAGKARVSNFVSPRKMLTMLQLILSMTQKLGPSILSKVTQIIGLANNILEHQVTSRKDEEKDKDDIEQNNAEDDDGEDADMEILGLVLTLLTAILNENEHLSQQDRHLLAMTLVHLKQLSDHPLIEIRRVAHDLQMLIPPRLSESSDGSDKTPKKTEMEIEMEKYASALAALQDSLLPVRAHGLHILREMILEKSIVLTGEPGSSGKGRQNRELDHALDIFIQHVQEPDSFIYLNAVKGLAALTDAHGPEILKKLMRTYSNENGKQKLDTRLRVGEALVQTVQRCGEALGAYTDALLPGLYRVMNTKMDEQTLARRVELARKRKEKVEEKRRSDALLTVEERQIKWKAEMARRNRMQRRKQGLAIEGEEEEGDLEADESGADEMQEADEEDVLDEVSLLRSSALTILATAIESCPLAMLPELRYLLDWVLSIMDLDPQIEVRRGAMLVIVLLLRALDGNALYRIEGDQLKRVYRTLRYVEDVDDDQLCRAQARAGIADLDAIVRKEMNPSQEGSHPWAAEISSAVNKLGEIRFR